jgi:hypothetical protein
MFWKKKKEEEEKKPEEKYIGYICSECKKVFLKKDVVLVVSPFSIRQYWDASNRDTVMCFKCIDKQANALIESCHKPNLLSAYLAFLGIRLKIRD